MSAERIKWYRTKIDKSVLKELNKRSDLMGLLQSVSVLLIAVATGGAVYYTFVHQAWLFMFPALLLHGAAVSILGPPAACHELSHGTPFKTKALNEFFYRLFAFIAWTNPVWFRVSHTHHHMCTLYQPRDLEVTLPRKVRWSDLLFSLTTSPAGVFAVLKTHFLHASGKITGEWGEYIFPERDVKQRAALIRWARILILGHIALAALFIWLKLYIYLLIVVFPLYGGWLAAILTIPQHAGLQSSVPDFRRSCRTVRQGWISSFLYWQMNYHIEHHMYAAVPFFNLPKLHKLVQEDGAPQPNSSLFDAWREIIAWQKHQKVEPDTAFDTFSRGGDPLYVPQNGEEIP